MEGPTGDPAINALRARQQRNPLATLLLSQGVPMILAGDEFGRTQQGNNNAYSQDNSISWTDSDMPAYQPGLAYPLQGRSLVLLCQLFPRQSQEEQ